MRGFKTKLVLIAGAAFLFVLFAMQLEAKEANIWVSKHFVGGKQCETTKEEWPNPEKLFKENRITIHDKKMEHGFVCSACGCPAYSFDQSFLINKKDVGKADKIGFKNGK